MVAIPESNQPGEGNLNVRGALLAIAAVYGALGLGLIWVSLKEARASGFDESARGISWTIGVVLVLASVHGFVARGARPRRPWARAWSRA